MNLAFVLASLLAAQPAAAAGGTVRDLVYLPIPSGDPGTLDAAEAIVRAANEAGPVRLRRSAADPGALARCVDEPALIDRVNRCIRRQLPRRERGLPLVAILIDNIRVSDVIGRHVHTRHDLYCIGNRSISRAEMNDRLQPSSRPRRPPPPAPVRDCLVAAASPAAVGALGAPGRESAPLWRLSPGWIAQDESMARGSSAEHATIRIESRRASAGRACLLLARVLSVEQGERLREGDRIRLALPCAAPPGEAPGLAAARTIRPGARARLYIGYDGGLRYLDPL
jgi:hypothetical protein